MRRFILWIAAILITFAIGVGADRLWWRFFTAPTSPTRVEAVAAEPVPQREVVYVTAPTPPPSPPKPHLILDYDSEQLSVWAVFYIMGPQLKEFADIDSIEAELSPESQESLGNISLYAHKGDDQDNANAIFGLVTDQRIFFATEKRDRANYSYRFDGKFLRTDFNVVAGKNKAVLRGTLTKMKNGRTIAEQEFTFRMEYVGC